MKLKACKKAFTLAEVLITLSILGVVAALTIPSIVNRNSDIAAITKLKKAIATYENVTSTYFAESGKNDLKDWMGDKCVNAESYFKIVDIDSLNNEVCKFWTSDGAYWVIRKSNGSAYVYDAYDKEKFEKKRPRYGVHLWAEDGNVNIKTTVAIAMPALTGELLSKGPVHKYYSGRKFLKLSIQDLVKGTDGLPYSGVGSNKDY